MKKYEMNELKMAKRNLVELICQVLVVHLKTELGIHSKLH